MALLRLKQDFIYLSESTGLDCLLFLYEGRSLRSVACLFDIFTHYGQWQNSYQELGRTVNTGWLILKALPTIEQSIISY